MTDYYEILGVQKSSTPEEIKRAYRKLAAKHHPDRGGDTAKFQEIQAAYDVLSNADKRLQYDNPQSQYEFQGGVPPGFEDIINAFGGGFGDFFGRRRAPPQNRTITIQTAITLEEALSGKTLIATVKLPSGRDQLLEVKIPAGVHDGTTLRLANMGDDSYQNLPRGDIHLSVRISPHTTFQRNGDDLLTSLEITAIEAMLGKVKEINTLDGRTLSITIKPGTQHGQLLAAQGYGMPKMSDSRFIGRLIVQISVKIPTFLTEDQITKLKEIFNHED